VKCAFVLIVVNALQAYFSAEFRLSEHLSYMKLDGGPLLLESLTKMRTKT